MGEINNKSVKIQLPTFPIPQIINVFKPSAELKNSINPCNAPNIWANIRPTSKIVMLFLCFFDMITIIIVTLKAPKIENKVTIDFPIIKNPETFNDVNSIVAIATNKLAPLLIPNAYGPAKGFLNKLCISKPQIAKPDPAMIQVNAFGRRILYKIVENKGDDELIENKFILPKHKSQINNTINITVK